MSMRALTKKCSVYIYIYIDSKKDTGFQWKVPSSSLFIYIYIYKQTRRRNFPLKSGVFFALFFYLY
jgi:hypothetical protein